MMVNTYELIFFSKEDKINKISYFSNLDSISDFINKKGISKFVLTEVIFFKIEEFKKILDEINYSYVGLKDSKIIKIPKKVIKNSDYKDNELLLYFNDYYSSFIKELESINFFNHIDNEESYNE